jgi:hypothetical protein
MNFFNPFDVVTYNLQHTLNNNIYISVSEQWSLNRYRSLTQYRLKSWVSPIWVLLNSGEWPVNLMSVHYEGNEFIDVLIILFYFLVLNGPLFVHCILLQLSFMTVSDIGGWFKKYPHFRSYLQTMQDILMTVGSTETCELPCRCNALHDLWPVMR